MKNLGLCYRHEGGICAKEGESIPVIKRRERGVHTGATKERIHLTLQAASNSAGVLYKEEGWEKEDGTGLLVPQ